MADPASKPVHDGRFGERFDDEVSVPGILWITSSDEGEKMISPSSFHEPARGLACTVQRFKGGVPVTLAFFSLPPEKKAINRLSGDQNGCWPSSVPGSGRDSG